MADHLPPLGSWVVVLVSDEPGSHPPGLVAQVCGHSKGEDDGVLVLHNCGDGLLLDRWDQEHCDVPEWALGREWLFANGGQPLLRKWWPPS
jgi:hypothetical protein